MSGLPEARWRRLACAVALVAIAAPAACRRDASQHPGAGAPRHVVLVVIDTLRADHVGAYGGSASTPVLDALAREGARFHRAYAHIPITGPSHATLFTGLLPIEHKVEGNAQLVAETLTWLPERLGDLGFETAGFVSLGVLQETWGFAQGFDHFDDDFPGQWFRPAAAIRERVGRWLARADDEPSFLWVHLSDPHEPYAPPGLEYPEIEVLLDGEPIAVAKADGYNWTIPLALTPGDHEATLRPRAPTGPLVFRSIHETGGKADLTLGEGWDAPAGSKPIWMNVARLPASLRLHNAERRDLTPDLRFFCHEELEGAELRKRYALEVENADRELGRIIQSLKDHGWWSDTLLVLTSDHGEGLGQHDLIGHIEQLYDTLLHVPLLMVSPGRVPAGVVVQEPVRHVDVAATVFDYLGVAAPASRGRSLRPLLSGGSAERRPVVSMTLPPTAAHRRRSLLLGRMKYIFTEDGGVEELYDVIADPGELDDLAARQPESVAKLRSRLELLMVPLAGAGAEAVQAIELTDEERRQLQALGYLR
jgi:arylsulfatase A-like enzyme